MKLCGSRALDIYRETLEQIGEWIMRSTEQENLEIGEQFDNKEEHESCKM